MERKEFEGINFPFPTDKTKNIIKVIGVGGGGSNAVITMYERGVQSVRQ